MIDDEWIVILDCPCGEEHLAPGDEGYQQNSEWRPATASDHG